MLDSRLRPRAEPFWERVAAPLVRMGLTPNQVTVLGTLLIAFVSGLYLLHGSTLVFGLSLILASLFDALDGAVARARGMRSKAGGYLDAVADRYQELAVLAAFAAGTGFWALALLAFSGGVLTSYAKARAALEMPVSNRGWPDFFERVERTIFLCTLLVLGGLLQVAGLPHLPFLWGGLALYAGLTHFTALQRAARAMGMLRAADTASRPNETRTP